MRKLFMLVIPALLAAVLPSVSSAQPQSQSQERTAEKPRVQQSQAASVRQQTSVTARGRYGEWESAWGKAPPAPPAHFTNSGDWHRHVRACQQRFRSYIPRTDTYRAHSGKLVRCRL